MYQDTRVPDDNAIPIAVTQSRLRKNSIFQKTTKIIIESALMYTLTSILVLGTASVWSHANYISTAAVGDFSLLIINIIRLTEYLT